MRRMLLTCLAAGLAAAALSALPASGADSGTVNMTISVASPCLLISPDHVEFPPTSFSPSAESPRKAEGKHSHQVSNCSETTEPIFAKGTDAVGSVGAHWALVDAPGIDVNKYALDLGHQHVTRSDQAVVSGPLAPGEDRLMDLFLWMPTVGSAGSGQTMSMSLTYTATF